MISIRWNILKDSQRNFPHLRYSTICLRPISRAARKTIQDTWRFCGRSGSRPVRTFLISDVRGGMAHGKSRKRDLWCRDSKFRSRVAPLRKRGSAWTQLTARKRSCRPLIVSSPRTFLSSVPNVLDVFEQARSSCGPGGLFVAFTPNGSEINRRVGPEDWHSRWGFVHPQLLDGAVLSA